MASDHRQAAADKPLPDQSGEQSAARRIQPRKRFNVRRGLVVRVVAIAGLSALLVGWVLALLMTQPEADRSDSQAVARHFIQEIQQAHPHRAYLLTTPTYQHANSEESFTKTTATDLYESTPQTEPKLLDSSKLDSRQNITYSFSIPADKETPAYIIALRVQRLDDGQWGISDISGYKQ